VPDLGLEGDGGGFERELRGEVEVDEEVAALRKVIWGDIRLRLGVCTLYIDSAGPSMRICHL
jgi:hypothetical protein